MPHGKQDLGGGDCHRNGNRDQYRREHRHRDSDEHSDVHADRNSDEHRDGHADRDSHRNPDVHGYAGAGYQHGDGRARDEHAWSGSSGWHR